MLLLSLPWGGIEEIDAQSGTTKPPSRLQVAWGGPQQFNELWECGPPGLFD